MIKLVIGAVVAVVIIVGVFVAIDSTKQVNTGGTTTEVNNKSTYTIEGEVLKPGTYSLESEITMATLISSAGGVTTNTDDLAYFPNAVIKPNVTYYIAPKFDATDICSSKEIAKVNINTSDVTTLKTINGITTTIADSIINYRSQNGTFSYLEQLLDVYGIGNATYRKIRNYVTLHE